MCKHIYNSPAGLITKPALIHAEKSRDIAGDIAKYWSHVTAPISNMTCAFATAGSRQIANAVLISRSLIFPILLDTAPKLYRVLQLPPDFWPLPEPPNARDSAAALAYPSTAGTTRLCNQPHRPDVCTGASKLTGLFPV